MKGELANVFSQIDNASIPQPEYVIARNLCLNGRKVLSMGHIVGFGGRNMTLQQFTSFVVAVLISARTSIPQSIVQLSQPGDARLRKLIDRIEYSSQAQPHLYHLADAGTDSFDLLVLSYLDQKNWQLG